VIDPSTGAGLGKLAGAQEAAVIVFGSDYRTPPGRVEPGSSAQQLLQDGSVAVAVAAAGLRALHRRAIETIAVSPSEDDDAAQQTAGSLAQALGAAVVTEKEPDIDLIVVGSAPSAPRGRIALSGASRSRLDSVRSSVLVLARETAIAF
jgi:nucleotide-binding universal stress UspA family protein